jgi:hypothetical protein
MFRLNPEAKLCQSISIDGGILTFEYLNGTVEEKVDKTAELSTYKGKTWWRNRDGRYWFMVAARADSTLIEKLGQIWKKNDGRWVWVRHKSKYQGRWSAGQGVAASKQEAANKVVEGWYVC